jgi:hypothetical protein
MGSYRHIGRSRPRLSASGGAAAGTCGCPTARGSSWTASTARCWWRRTRCRTAWTRSAAAAASPARPASPLPARPPRPGCWAGCDASWG